MSSHKHTLLVCFTVMAVGCFGCGDFGPQEFASSKNALESSSTFRVAAWNVESVGAPGSTEYNAVLSVLDRIGADVVGINEVSSNADVDNFVYLAADAGYPYWIVPSDNYFGSLRCAIMSRYELLETAVHRSDTLSGDPNANDITRYVVEAVVDVPDSAQDLTAVVQHWKSGTGNDDEFRRVVESNRVAQVVADLDSASDAYVIMGDFNEEIDSVPRSPNPFTSLPGGLPSTYSLGADLEAVMTSVGFENDPFYYLQQSEGPEATFLDAYQLDGLDATRPSSGRRLDYIAVSQALLAQGPLAEVYDSTDEGLGGGLPKYGSPLPDSTSMDASDHLLVFTDLVFAGSGCSSDADCDDGIYCNGAETCDAAQTCQPGIPVACDDGVACTVDSCNEASDSCDAVPSDALCDNGVFCDGAETCDAALDCQAGIVPDCSSASDQCNQGVCDVVADACISEPLPEGTACDNGDSCGGDTCQAGVCQAAPCGPAAPQGLTADFGRNVELSWQRNQERNLAGYRVYRATSSGGPYTLLGERSPRKTSYTDRSPAPGDYCYAVTAFDKNNQESAYSDEVCGQVVKRRPQNHPHLP